MITVDCKAGDRVLLWAKELLDAAEIGKLRPRRDSPLTVLAHPSPNASRRMRCSRPPSPPPVAAPPPPPPPPPPQLAAATQPPAAPPLVVVLAGFRLPTVTPAKAAAGPSVRGRTVLYYWPGDG